MKFQYYNPIRFQFGTDAFEQIPELCKGHRVLLVYGGASAMDIGKAIALGAVHGGLEDYIEGKKTSDNRHLFNIIIPTYSATGSEANGVCDIMEYKGGGEELFGACPDKEYILKALDPEDFSEFTQDERYQMISACYQSL